MEGWMIALIVVASVIVFLALALLVASLASTEKILGRRGENKMKGVSPEMYGVDVAWMDEHQDVTDTLTITSYDGIKLRALLIKHPDAEVHKVAICHHGYWATPRSMQPYARIFYDKGFDVLMPAARAHDISDGNFVGMAWLDRFDLLRWTDKIINLYGKDVAIAYMGVSMGGATVAAAASMDPPEQVKCVVDDCGFNSQRDEYAACAKEVHVPVPLALLLLDMGVRMRGHYSIYDADIAGLAKNMKIPALFIHGEQDTFVPCELGKKLFDACGSPDKTFHSVPDAPHALSYVKQKDEYIKLVSDFVDKHIPE